MPVDFGRRRAAGGRHRLAEDLESGFWVHADVDLVRLWQTIDRTCESTPRKPSVLGTKGLLPFYRSGFEEAYRYKGYDEHGHMLEARRIGFGHLNSSGDGFSMAHGLSWQLDVSGDRPTRHLGVSTRLDGGKVDDLPVLESFLDSFETNLRELDPGARISFVADDPVPPEAGDTWLS